MGKYGHALQSPENNGSTVIKSKLWNVCGADCTFYACEADTGLWELGERGFNNHTKERSAVSGLKWEWWDCLCEPVGNFQPHTWNNDKNTHSLWIIRLKVKK